MLSFQVILLYGIRSIARSDKYKFWVKFNKNMFGNFIKEREFLLPNTKTKRICFYKALIPLLYA